MPSINKDKSWLHLNFHDEDKQHIIKPDELNIDKKDYPPSINNDHLLDRIQGSMIGMAIGDALGAHVEFRPHTYLEANPVKDLEGGGTWGLEKGQFTDDTSMALCLASSLIACQDFVPYDQLLRYKWWYRNGYMSSTGHCFDIGAATRQSIQVFEARQRQFAQDYRISLEEMDFSSNPDLFQEFNVYCSKDGVAGNGALMRLAPVPLFFYRDPVKAAEYSGISGRITHGDDKAYDACRYYGALIVAALQGMTKEELLKETFYDEHKPWFDNKDLHSDIRNIVQGSYKKKRGYEEGIRGKGYVVNALEAALWAFWSDEDSFEKGVLNAVNLGDDTDTTAAIYGQLAGAYYGYKKLPEKWRELIYAKNFVLCVSNWIAYEGEKWFKSQAASDGTAPLINSNPTAERESTITNSNRESYSSNNNQFNTSFSMGRNSMAIINRKAIDPSGRIGSFYDVCHDCIVKLPPINLDIKENQDSPSTKCIITRGDQIECQNLLKFIGFDDEFRLSLLTNIVSPTGIASIIEYPYLIDECTRVFYYSYTIRQKSLFTDVNNIRERIEKSTYKGNASHIITEIDIGIELIIILRLKSDDSNIIDDTLNNIKQSLINDKKLTGDILLDEILSTDIYSNIDHLNQQKTLIDVYHKLWKIKTNLSDYQPSNYILHSIDTFIQNNNRNCLTFIPMKPTIVQKIEQHLFTFSSINKMWLTALRDDKSNTIKIYLEEQIDDVVKEISRLDQQYNNEKKRLQQLILNQRYKKDSQNNIEYQLLNEDLQKILENNTDQLIYSIISLKEKGLFIDDLKKRGFDYHNANKYNIKQNDDENIIEQKLIGNNRNSRIICSNDTLNNNNFSTLEQLLNEIKLNSHLIYVDFTYSSYDLDQIKVYPSIKRTNDPNKHTSLLLSMKPTSNHPLPIDDKTINILLLGKSDVGKTTLINTLKDYLQFNRYEDAQSNRYSTKFFIPFVYRIRNDLFEEHFIRIGICDPNENHDHPDQSITQQCKLYRFNLKNNEKLCIIDTPGFDKTDNKDNDDITMQHILSRIINLTHLNAICILIQSDDIKLDHYQICLTKLFHFLGNNASKNILFCFTKSLSKNINNDDKRNDLIKLMLQSLPTSNISFNEETTFDFDSTYFINSTISNLCTSFQNSSSQLSQRSWTISKNGWDRLLNYISQNLRHPYYIQQGLQKIQLSRFEINQLIRPLLETIRNNIRNFILSRTVYSNYSIELHPIPLMYPSAICYSCKPSYYQCGDFWISSDSPHEYRNKCYECSCNPGQHIRIDYRLICTYLNNQYRQSDISRRDLIRISAYLSYFLLKEHYTTNNDLFLFHLNKIIDEERSIYQNLYPHRFNLELYKYLMYFRHDYQQEINRIKQKNLNDDFDIDDLIEKVKQIPIIKIQLDAARNMQETSLETHLYQRQLFH